MMFLRSLTLAFLLLMSCNAQAQTGGAVADREIALRFVDALDSQRWADAAGMLNPGHGVTVEALTSWWTEHRERFGLKGNWRGTPDVVSLRRGSGHVLRLPIIPTGEDSGVDVVIREGKVDSLDIVPRRERFGVYAWLVGQAFIRSDGFVLQWYLSDTGRSVIAEQRHGNGQLYNVEIIKPTGNGSLLMLRSGECPENVCGQTGTLVDGIVNWKYPAIGAHVGNFMQQRMWLEPNRVLVEEWVDPNPRMTPGIPSAPVYTRTTLVDAPQGDPVQNMEAMALAVQMESQAEAQVASLVNKQIESKQAMDDAQAARKRSSERVQSFNRLMGSVGSALADATAGSGGYAESQANLDATVANINAAAAMERQQQALAAQQAQARAAEADRHNAQQNALRAQEGLRAQAMASAPGAGSHHSGGSLVVESVAKSPRADSTPSDPNAVRQMLLACFLVHNGEFDQGKGVVFFSSTVPVTEERGRPVGGDPTGTFRRKVKSTYNIDGGTACQTATHAAELQRFMQEVGDRHRAHKKIDTGMSPLD